MSNKTVISVKVDKDVRDKARKVAKKIGVPLSMVVNRQLQRFAEEQQIEFRTPERFNVETAKELRAALEDIKKGKNLITFKSAKEMDNYLLSL